MQKRSDSQTGPDKVSGYRFSGRTDVRPVLSGSDNYDKNYNNFTVVARDLSRRWWFLGGGSGLTTTGNNTTVEEGHEEEAKAMSSKLLMGGPPSSFKWRH
ncbi:hypothetical protein PIB30_040083 [Stylosanthes scabra]|uniref:Uncharacterized protein n=1 Tax=Stylosanthes scabra TaxID=79078 RepID=A0ABU6YEZ6_9FABA|nr:hypothetical protein [Stylosanthes scabra]